MRRISSPILAFFPLLLLVLGAACSDGGGGGPEEAEGLLRVSAADLDQASLAVAPAGFDVDDVTSYRIRINAGPRVVFEDDFVKRGPIQQDFSLKPNSYVVQVEGFQGDRVLLLAGVGEATVLPGDTAALAVDLDPALGAVELTIDGGPTAAIPTNGSAPVRVLVRNRDGEPVSGASVEVAVDPPEAGSITFTGPAETGPDGVFQATFTPERRVGQGQLRLSVDGFPIDFASPRSFSVVSPVDAGRSALNVTNGDRLPADGVSEADIRVVVVDRASVPQAGIPVVVRSSRNGAGAGGALDRIRSDQTETDATGEFRATLRTSSSSSLAGDAVITAEADGKTLADRATVTFRSVVNVVDTEIQVTPLSLPANGVAAADIEVRVVDLSGRPLPDAFVQLETKDNSLFRISPESGRTDRNGVFRSRISSTIETGTFVDVVADGVRTSATAFIVFF